MKVYVFFFVCGLAYISFISAETVLGKLKEQDTKQGSNFVNTCLSEVALADEDNFEIDDIINNVHLQPENQEKRRKHGCVMECILKKIDWMEGSELMEERIYGNVTKVMKNNPLLSTAQKIIRDCSAKVKEASAENCERGVVGMTCIVQAINNLIESIFDFSSSSEEHTEAKTEE